MKYYIKFLFLLIIVFGCSTPEETVKRDTENYKKVLKFNNELNLDVIESISWINMMPGTSPKFHVSGKINLQKGENYSSENTELKYIKIYQSGEELYYIMPKVINSKAGGINTFTYSTIKGLSINDKLDKKEPVVFELIFIDNKEELKFRINNVKVEEVQ
jgi:hypothetical protein